MTRLLVISIMFVASALMIAGADDIASGANSNAGKKSHDDLQKSRNGHGWSENISVAEGPRTIKVDDISFTFRGDVADPGKVLIDITGRKKPLAYRFWPDIEKWQLSEEGKTLYSKEFKDIPGWQKRTISVSVDASQSVRQLWVEERLVKEWQSAVKSHCLINSGKEKNIKLKIRSEENGAGPYLVVPLVPYFNDGLATPYAPDKSIGLGNGVLLQFESNVTTPHHIDLGKMEYRTAHMKTGPFQRLSMPYFNCDAMSSDPKRAIFRVPARFYDRLHLLVYADNDKADVARAAVRFLKIPRARFLTYEFGLHSEKGVHILETHEVGGREYVHIAVDINPAAFQEFLIESKNDYLEFELTRPVVMDNNSLEHPAGPPSSLHVLSLALEEAPVNMVIGSDIPGHLFEHADDKIMQIKLKSNRRKNVAGTIQVHMVAPDGQTREQRIPYKLHPEGNSSFDIDVSDEQVGKSDFTVRLETTAGTNEKRVMERRTSFAIIPKFQRTSKHSPFGMWSFFEGHHGTDIETTCGVLRKAGVRGTYADFLLGRNPDSWKENERRTKLLRKYNIEMNWGYLAGMAQTSMNGLGDLDAKFAWIKAHPQVKDYNLFWETSVSASGRKHKLCPPEIRGRPPIKWSKAEQKQINTFLNFGKTWVKRARKDAPDIRIAFGNGFPLFTSAMLQNGFPLKYIDTLGLDFDMYTSAPDDQPSMWYSPFSGIYYLRELRKIYSCENKPLCLTEAIYCPTSPIWISERQQADYYVRSHLLALAMGVKQFGMCTEPIDPDGYYHYGHYGPVGLCHAAPEINPREAFCAYATMTGLLDGVKFESMVDLGSPHAYGLRFRKDDGRYLYAFWTVNGSRKLKMKIDGTADLIVYNRDGRIITNKSISHSPASKNTNVILQLDESPQYVLGSKTLKIEELGNTDSNGETKDTRSFIHFNSLDDWETSKEPLAGYEEINLATPVAWENLNLSVKDGKLNVRNPTTVKTHPLETICMFLRHTGKPLEIPQQAEAIGVYASGDRSWGRVVFVLEDKVGDRWISAYSQTQIDVDGKIYLETALPKAPSPSQPDYRNYRPWNRDKDDTVPEYPLRLKGLLLETRTHAIHGSGLVPLSNIGFKVHSIVLR